MGDSRGWCALVVNTSLHVCMLFLYFSAQPLGFCSVGLAPWLLCAWSQSQVYSHTGPDLGHACYSNMNSYLHRCITRVLIICVLVSLCVYFLPHFCLNLQDITKELQTVWHCHSPMSMKALPDGLEPLLIHKSFFTDTRMLPRGKGGHCLPWSVASAASLVQLILSILLSDLADLYRMVPVQNRSDKVCTNTSHRQDQWVWLKTAAHQHI